MNVENSGMVSDCLRSREDDQLADCFSGSYLIKGGLVYIKWQKSKASFLPPILGLSLLFRLTELMGF